MQPLSRRFAGLAALLALAGACLAQPPASSSSPKFAEVVKEHFVVWDSDHNGVLSAVEVDARCVDAGVKGAEAAAVAAIKRVVRSDRYELPALTLDYLLTVPPPVQRNSARGGQPPAAAVDQDRVDSGEALPAAAARPAPGDETVPTTKPTPRGPDWAAGYRQCLTRIERTDRDLFDHDEGDGLPTLERCHQGPLGDCYFVSVVGAAVSRDAAAVKGMITPRAAEDGGGYSVKWGTGRVVNVAPLTDGEVALSSTTSGRSGDDGLWLAVLEKAFGTMRLEDSPEKYQTEAATDAIAKGGSTRTTIRLLTGHETERLTLRKRALPPAPTTVQKDESGRRVRRIGTPPGPSLVVAGDEAELAAKLRKMVGEALAEKRLATAGTADERLTPGISPRHAYAILAYDAAKDTFTIWNPHGNTFPPRGKLKGEPGVENGYVTKAGVFEVPVGEMARVFQGVVVETGREAGKKS